MSTEYSVFNKMDFPVCIIGTDGQLLYKNDMFKNHIGIDDISIMLDVDHPLYPEYRKRIAISYHKAFSGDQTKCFAVMKSATGSKLPVEIYLYPMKTEDDSEILAFFKLVDDRILSFDKSATPISEVDSAENINFFEFTPFPIVRFDSDYNIRILSASIEEIIGCSRDQLRTNPEKFFKVLSEYDYERIKKTMKNLFAGNIRFKRLNEIKIVSLKGEEKYVNAILYPVKLKKKNIKVEILFEDITKIKNYENKLSIMNRGQIIVDLSKGLLNSFSNIINIVSSRSQMLLKQTTKKAVVDGLTVINDAAIDATRQIKRVHEFIEREETIDDIDETEDINEVIEDAIAFSRIHFKLEKKEKGRNIVIKKENFKSLKVSGNIKVLREIIVTMIFKVSNNINKNGEIFVKLRESEDLFISVSTKKDINNEEVKSDSICYPFSELEIRRISEKINIRIFEEESSEKFSIKAVIPTKMIYDIVTEKDELVNKKVHDLEILIVEEEKALCEILQDYFEELGNSVTICSNGLVALDKIRKIDFDLVISDYSIAGITGLEFLAKVKELNENIPTALLSGWVINDLKDYNLIVDLYVSKPFQLDDLIKDISKIIIKSY